jgi:death-on-curing protein
LTDDFEYLDLDDVLALADRLLGSTLTIRDAGLLGSAVARPSTNAFGADVYADVREKAAALLQSIVKNHALVDGNKRLGWLATAVFLELNGVDATTIANDDVYELVMDVAASDRDVASLARSLQALAG